MNLLKKISTTAFLLFLIMASTNSVKATEECFEGLSRSVFKFNMAFDDIVLEPIAKGYNKLPDSIKSELVISHQI